MIVVQMFNEGEEEEEERGRLEGEAEMERKGRITRNGWIESAGLGSGQQERDVR